MAVKVSKDKKIDVAYVQFRNGKVQRTIEVHPGVLLDLDSKGGVLGIEVMALSKLAPVLRAVPRSSSKGQKAA